MKVSERFVGIDVAKAPWDVAVRPTGEAWTTRPGGARCECLGEPSRRSPRH